MGTRDLQFKLVTNASGPRTKMGGDEDPYQMGSEIESQIGFECPWGAHGLNPFLGVGFCLRGSFASFKESSVQEIQQRNNSGTGH